MALGVSVNAALRGLNANLGSFFSVAANPADVAELVDADGVGVAGEADGEADFAAS